MRRERRAAPPPATPSLENRPAQQCRLIPTGVNGFPLPERGYRYDVGPRARQSSELPTDHTLEGLFGSLKPLEDANCAQREVTDGTDGDRSQEGTVGIEGAAP